MACTCVSVLVALVDFDLPSPGASFQCRESYRLFHDVDAFVQARNEVSIAYAHGV